jgi:hypothetical protein
MKSDIFLKIISGSDFYYPMPLHLFQYLPCFQTSALLLYDANALFCLTDAAFRDKQKAWK